MACLNDSVQIPSAYQSLVIETVADIAAWFLAEIQRKETAENGFEVEQKDGIPLNCNLPALKGTTQKIRTMFGAKLARLRQPAVFDGPMASSIIFRPRAHSGGM